MFGSLLSFAGGDEHENCERVVDGVDFDIVTAGEPEQVVRLEPVYVTVQSKLQHAASDVTDDVVPGMAVAGDRLPCVQGEPHYFRVVE